MSPASLGACRVGPGFTPEVLQQEIDVVALTLVAKAATILIGQWSQQFAPMLLRFEQKERADAELPSRTRVNAKATNLKSRFINLFECYFDRVLLVRNPHYDEV